MYTQVAIAVSAASLIGLLGGCAGYHSMPPAGYSSPAPTMPVVKLVFDQDGAPYPESFYFIDPGFPGQKPSRDKGFSVASHYGPRYDREAILDRSAERITAAARGVSAERIVILIKGFNNSFAASDKEFAEARARIERLGHGKPLVFVQVYWDSLFRGPGTAPAPLAYFGDSMTYSNLAGMCGLRRLMRRLPEGTNVTFVTHSRGVAVALGTAQDPLFDDHIKKCEPSPDLPLQLGDVRLIAFAPAIGDGHMRKRHPDRRAEKGFYDVIDRFYVGFDRNDYATAKKYAVRLGGGFGGDTRLNSSHAYFEEIQEQSDGRLDRVIYTHDAHDWMVYLDTRPQAECLFWAGRLSEARPADCKLAR